MKQPQVQNICDQIKLLNRNNHDELSRLKRQLPVITPHACRFDNDGTRKSTNAIPSGLVMLDIDHIDNPRDFFSTHIFPHLGEKSLERPRELIGAQVVEDKVVDVVDNNAPCIYFVAITPSGHGLRLIAERNAGESIPDAQLRIASACNISEYDGVTTDLARASFLMPWSYVLYCEPLGLDFENEDHLHKITASSPLTCSEASYSSQSERPIGGTPSHSLAEASHSEASTYRGLPYSDIVSQLLIAIGNCGGAEIGERNTVYFTLASYMRYICDFNPDLLLRVLPDFGLSVQERRQVI